MNPIADENIPSQFHRRGASAEPPLPAPAQPAVRQPSARSGRSASRQPAQVCAHAWSYVGWPGWWSRVYGSGSKVHRPPSPNRTSQTARCNSDGLSQQARN